MRFLDDSGLRWVCCSDLLNWMMAFAIQLETGEFLPGAGPDHGQLVWNIVAGIVESDLRDRQ